MFRRCPKAWLNDDARKEHELFRQWSWLRRHGVMPRIGGLDDQDPLFVEAVDVIEDELSKIKEEARAKEAR
jgi:hypothetical protein